jgi:hypothetical protein
MSGFDTRNILSIFKFGFFFFLQDIVETRNDVRLTRWNYGLLDRCHKGEEFRLFDERIYPLNKSNTKYLKVGYSPFDNFNLKYVIWDVLTNREICLQLFDIVSIQLYLDSTAARVQDYELSTAFVRPNNTHDNLLHIIEKGTHKMLSFQVGTLKNLVQAKQLYQFEMSRPDLMEKADECVAILSELCLSSNITPYDIDNYFEKLTDKTKSRDRVFIGELFSKFPTTFLAAITHC